MPAIQNAAAIEQVLRKAGVDFIDENGGGPGCGYVTVSDRKSRSRARAACDGAIASWQLTLKRTSP